MTFTIGTIEGGTHAGWRQVAEKPEDWECPDCGRFLKGYWVKCPVCGTEREEHGTR